MLIYLDKRFTDEFFKLDTSNYQVWTFFDEIIKKSKSYSLYTSYSENEFKELLMNNPLIRGISNGVESIGFNLPLQLLKKTNSHDHKLLLLSDTIDALKLMDEGIESFASKSIRSKWPNYSPYRDDLDIPVTTNNAFDRDERFSDWNDLLRFTHPITDIYVYDKYLLTDNSSGPIEKNLIPMLEVLNKMSKAKKHIRIFALAKMFQSQSDQPEKEKAEKLGLAIKKVVPECRLSISLINYLSDIPHDRFIIPHDRFILTNYFLIDRGAGFNLFTKKNEVFHEDSSILFRFLFLKRNHSMFKIKKDIVNNLKVLSEKNTGQIVNYHF